MPEAIKRFDYHVRDWWPQIRWYDWVPVVGLVTAFERTRKQRGESLAETLIPWKDPTIRKIFEQEPKDIAIDLISLGTAKWPESTTPAAHFRSILMAARNGFFPAYHLVGPMYVYLYGPQIVYSLESLIQK